MKRRLLYFLGAILITAGVFFGANFAETYACAPGVMVNGLCVGVTSEVEGYFLDRHEICGSEEWDCRYIYRSPYTGEPLVLPDAVSENLTPLSYPHLLSPYLGNLAYVNLTEDGAEVHVYNLAAQEDAIVGSFGLETSGVYSFNWLGEEQLSFVTLNYDAAEPESFTAERHLYEWHDEMWNIILREFVEEGEVECNPIYCELK